MKGRRSLIDFLMNILQRTLADSFEQIVTIKCSLEYVLSRGAVSSLLADGSWLLIVNVTICVIFRPRISSRSCFLSTFRAFLGTLAEWHF